MRTSYFLTTFFILAFTKNYAQFDSTKVFEKSKGLWKYPIRKGTLIGNGPANYTSKKCTFITNKADSVFAVFDGYVFTIRNIDSAYLLITKYANYTIAYFGLEKPLVKEGDIIKSGQPLAIICKDLEDLFTLDVYLAKGTSDLDAHKWFK